VGQEQVMGERLVWRSIYGRQTIFLDGISIGDAYPSKGSDEDVWRLRIWRPGRVQGGYECYILAPAGEETAKQALVDLLERARKEGYGG
jgi:hypothetical protein